MATIGTVLAWVALGGYFLVYLRYAIVHSAQLHRSACEAADVANRARMTPPGSSAATLPPECCRDPLTGEPIREGPTLNGAPAVQQRLVYRTMPAALQPPAHWHHPLRNHRGLFVTFGLFGTFVGVTVGLSGLGPAIGRLNNGDTTAITAAISNLVNGMETAFGTSVVGILLYVLVPVFEKQYFLRRFVRSPDGPLCLAVLLFNKHAIVDADDAATRRKYALSVGLMQQQCQLLSDVAAAVDNAAASREREHAALMKVAERQLSALNRLSPSEMLDAARGLQSSAEKFGRVVADITPVTRALHDATTTLSDAAKTLSADTIGEAVGAAVSGTMDRVVTQQLKPVLVCIAESSEQVPRALAPLQHLEAVVRLASMLEMFPASLRDGLKEELAVIAAFCDRLDRQMNETDRANEAQRAAAHATMEAAATIGEALKGSSRTHQQAAAGIETAVQATRGIVSAFGELASELRTEAEASAAVAAAVVREAADVMSAGERAVQLAAGLMQGAGRVGEVQRVELQKAASVISDAAERLGLASNTVENFTAEAQEAIVELLNHFQDEIRRAVSASAVARTHEATPVMKGPSDAAGVTA